jgi:hypothetical protein
MIIMMTNQPDTEKDNWWRFGEPDSGGDEIEFDPDVDEVVQGDPFDDPVST